MIYFLDMNDMSGSVDRRKMNEMSGEKKLLNIRNTKIVDRLCKTI